MTARAGVHRGDEGEASGVGEGGYSAGEGDEAVLDGLAEGFEGIAAELGQLVEEGEDPLPRTPWWARLTSPGRGTLPPPMRPALEME
jgi:hypothetical protein